MNNLTPPLISSENPKQAAREDVTLNIASTNEYVLTGTVGETQQLCDVNQRFYLLKCYPELTKDVPDFHCELLDAMCSSSIQYLVCVCPRGFAKTMIARATLAKALMTGASPFCVVINKTIKDAVNSAREVFRIITSDFFQQVYGKVELVVSRDGIGEYEFIQNGQYKVLYARGRDSALQGMNIHNMRPNLILCDDIEQAEDSDTEDNFEATKKWFFETMLFLMDEDNRRVIYIGNMNRAQSLIAELPNLSDWHSIVLSAIKADGTALWEDRFPLARLMAEFRQYCQMGLKHVWLAQKMSRVDNDSAGIISPDEIEYHSGLAPDDIEYGCITIDPAISDSSRADEAVIVAHGWKDKAWHELEMFNRTGVDPMQLINQAINMAVKWRLPLICIEAVAYQKALIPIMESALARRGLKNYLRVKPIASRGSKKARIQAWIGMLRGHMYKLERNNFAILSQLQSWQLHAKKDSQHDDRLDGCSMIMLAAQSYLHLMRRAVGDPILRMLEESRTSCVTGYDIYLRDAKKPYDFEYEPYRYTKSS